MRVGAGDAISDLKHPDHDDQIEWYGGMFNSTELDSERIRKDFSRIAARRKHPSTKRGT